MTRIHDLATLSATTRARLDSVARNPNSSIPFTRPLQQLEGRAAIDAHVNKIADETGLPGVTAMWSYVKEGVSVRAGQSQSWISSLEKKAAQLDPSAIILGRAHPDDIT